MHNAMMPHQRQTKEHLASKSSNEISREASETVRLDEFVEIDAK